MLAYLPKAAKAVYAAVVAFLSSLSVVMVGGVGFGDISDGQWVAAAIAGLIAGGGVYRIPNKEPR